jgi:hypothetical protein
LAITSGAIAESAAVFVIVSPNYTTDPVVSFCDASLPEIPKNGIGGSIFLDFSLDFIVSYDILTPDINASGDPALFEFQL